MRQLNYTLIRYEQSRARRRLTSVWIDQRKRLPYEAMLVEMKSGTPPASPGLSRPNSRSHLHHRRRSVIPPDHIERKLNEKAFVAGFRCIAEGADSLLVGFLREPQRSPSHGVDATGLDQPVSNPVDL